MFALQQCHLLELIIVRNAKERAFWGIWANNRHSRLHMFCLSFQGPSLHDVEVGFKISNIFLFFSSKYFWTLFTVLWAAFGVRKRSKSTVPAGLKPIITNLGTLCYNKYGRFLFMARNRSVRLTGPFVLAANRSVLWTGPLFKGPVIDRYLDRSMTVQTVRWPFLYDGRSFMMEPFVDRSFSY